MPYFRPRRSSTHATVGVCVGAAFLILTGSMLAGLPQESAGIVPATVGQPAEPAGSSESRLGQILIHMPSGLEAWYRPADDGSGIYVPAEDASPSLSALWKSNRWMVGLLIFGFSAQIVFMGRFAIQWIASEIRKKSVVPVSFWWLSLAGATMLMCYFALRGDPVGMAGQAFGWPIYARNLWLIARERKRTAAVETGAV